MPVGLPALQRAHKIGEITEKYKFDWSEAKQVLSQLKAEIAELEEALTEKDLTHIEHEMGDVLFSAAQVARHISVEPESALRRANDRFASRFEKMLQLCGGLEAFVQTTAEEKEKLWAKAKQEE